MIMEKESPTTKKHWGPESLLGWRKHQRGEAPSRSVLLMSCVGERGRGRPLLFFFFDALGSESAGAQSRAGRAGCRERSWGGRTPGMDALHVKTPKSWAPDQMFYYQSQARNQTSFDAVWRTPSRVFLCSGRKNDSIFTSCSKVRTSRAGPQKDPNRSRVGRRKKWHWLG